ncbi:MAG: PspA/IM30 family protein [Acidobacteriota bacterium]
MWQRFKRVIRSIFGSIIGAGEDPERILKQNIRDMNDQVPEMNAQIAMVRANLTLLEKEYSRYETELTDLKAKLKASLVNEREDLAMEFAMQLESVKQHASTSRLQVETAKKAYDKAVEVKKAFMREKERKTKEAMSALRAARQAKWQSQVADVMQSFEPAGIDATHDEMVRKVEEQAAVDSARLDMALDNVDVDSHRIEEEAQRIKASELVAQFKVEMGIEGGSGGGGAKTAKTKSGSRTIGKTAKKKTKA